MQPGTAFVEAGIWKWGGKGACWTELDCVALRQSFLHLDSSRRNLGDFSIPGCKYLSMDHYLV